MKDTLLGLALVAASTLALAQGPGYGSGGRGGYGPGMMGPGTGMGAGMMGPGTGMGPGMMGYGGCGPGAWHGQGGEWPLAIPDLSDEQREKILAIQEEHRRKNWDTMGQIRAEQFKLRRIYHADQIDPSAVAEQQKKVDELRRQLIKSRAEQHNQVVSVLTPEQRKKVRQLGPWWLREEGDE